MTNPSLSLRASIALILSATLLPVAAAADRERPPRLRDGFILVKPHPGTPPEQLDAELEKAGAKVARKLRGRRSEVRLVQVPAGRELEFANILRRNRRFAFVEPDQLVEPVAVVNDPSYGSQWHIPLMGAPSAWAYGTGKGVTVAVCDTGVNAGHPDLAGQTVPGWNTASNSSDTTDVHGHGTKISGVIAAAANNLIGGASVAPGARVMTMRITDRTDGFAYFSDMAECLYWAADNGARVANISYSGVAGSAAVANAASYMMDLGGLVFVAAGNDGADRGYDNSPYLVTAAATDSANNRASYSNFGAYVDVAAPGSGIFTTERGGGYASVSGTSFASPNAAAVAALVMSANPALTPTDVTSIITNTAKDLGAAGWDPYYGFGGVDAAAAVTLAADAQTSDRTPPAVAVANPVAGAMVKDLVTVDVQATDDFGVASVDLLVDGAVVASDTQEDPASPYVFRFAWDSKQALDGMHRLTAQAKDAAGNVGSAQEVAVTVANSGDTTPPVITSIRPSTGSRVTGTSTVLSATSRDNVAVASLVMSVNGYQCSAARRSMSCNWDLTKVAAGSYTMTTTVTDTARNQTVKTTTFKVVK